MFERLEYGNRVSCMPSWDGLVCTNPGLEGDGTGSTLDDAAKVNIEMSAIDLM